MKIFINQDLRISEIKNSFNKLFPYLKLEFFTVSHQEGKPTDSQYQVQNDPTIGEIKGVLQPGDIDIHEGLTAGMLEKIFQKAFGLNVQVFRKSTDGWDITTGTDDWTLKKLNEVGKMASDGRYA